MNRPRGHGWAVPWVPRLACATALLLASSLGPGAVAQEGHLTKAPKLIKFVEAVTPPGHAPDQTAVVFLSITIGDRGPVDDVQVQKSSGMKDYDDAAVVAAKQFVFEPAEFDNLPSSVVITYRYEFTVREELISVGPQVNFEGTVLERFKKKPLAGVQVAIADLSRGTETDDNGKFAFLDVPVGTHNIQLSGPTLITTRTEETIVKGKKKTVKYLVEEKDADTNVDEVVVVRASRIKKETVETQIVTEEARRVPGTQGDTLKVVQNLPGVGRSSFGSGQLVVWGAGPDDTKVFIDGVDIPALYHVGGIRSTVNGDLVKSIELIPGGFGAEWGRALGGVVKLETADLPSGVHGYVAADEIDTSGMVSASIGDRLTVGVAGRYSYLDKTLPLVTSSNVGEFVPIPRYDDYQGKIELKLRQGEKLSLLLLGSDDALQRTLYSTDPSLLRTQTESSYFHRLILRYERLMPDGSSFTITPFVGNDQDDNTYVFGPVPVDLNVVTNRFGLRSTYRQKLESHVTLALGLDAESNRSFLGRVGSLTLPSREGDIVVFGQAPGDQIAADNWSVNIVNVAPYAVAELTFGDLSVTPSLRFEPTYISGNRSLPPTGASLPIGYDRFELNVDPRLNATYGIGRRLTLIAGGGLYHEPPDPRDLSPVFGNPTLGSSQAIHTVAGVSFKLTGTLTFEAEGFYKWLSDLVARNPSATPQVADLLQQTEIGRIYGGQFLLRQQIFKGFFGWATYTISESDRKDDPTSAWRLFDYDQTHVLSLLASYDLGAGWQVGARFRFASGFPRTPVIGSYYDSKNDQYDPVFGPQNSIRIPPFYSLDARVEKSFTFGGRLKLNVFLDVQNLTNQSNPEEIVYNFDYSRQGYINGLPLLAVLGGRLEF